MATGRVILIVDDDEMDLLAMRTTLEARGYQVVTSRTGDDAVAQAQRVRPDLVIVDLPMPPPDGFEVCRRLADEDQLRGVPRVVVTALREKMHKMHTSADVQTRIDADAYIDKPIEPDELLACVGGLLDAKRQAG